MTFRHWPRLVYLAVCILAVLAWIWFGRFEAIEVPYVQF